MEYPVASAFSAEDCVQRFLEREGEKALFLGAKDTTVNAPSGYDWFTRSTPRDMARIGRAAGKSPSKTPRPGPSCWRPRSPTRSWRPAIIWWAAKPASSCPRS